MGWAGLVVGREFLFLVGWVGMGWVMQLFGGFGWVWVDEMDPLTTLIYPSISRI